MEAESFNISGRHSAHERLQPPLWHSRYVHLTLLKKNLTSLINKYIAQTASCIVADFGCGNMPYKSLIEPLAKDYIGIDLPGNPLAKVFVDLETNRTTLPDDTCDIVWSVQVLEHVSDPEKYLKESFRIVKPNGKLILCTHGHWMYHPDPIDYWRWTSSGLRLTIERQGFKVLESFGMMGLLPMSIQLFQDACLLHFPLVKYWKHPFCFIMQRLISMANRFTNFSKTTREYVNKDACVYFIVATKTEE